ncbi:MAG: glycosyltransferase [Planctomycetota bacterium]
MAEIAVRGRDLLTPTIGVIVPARDEARVVLRRLENLRIAVWPAGEHRVVLVDDGSTDDTLRRARAWATHEPRLPFRFDVVTNEVEPGKAGAIRQGLATLGPDVELVVLTDADVVMHPRALGALVAAFHADPGLAIACGAQRFVKSLADDGSSRGQSLGPLLQAGTFYDRATAWVRTLESRFGKLVSVHGQLLAWRSESNLSPRSGVAADDLDLVFQARRAGGRARRVAAAVFYEEKTPPGSAAREQALRRARAWFQIFVATERALGPSALDRAQEFAYRALPRWLPEILAAAAVLLTVGLFLAESSIARGASGAALVLLALLAWRLPLGLVREARRSPAGLTDRWTTRRAGE